MNQMQLSGTKTRLDRMGISLARGYFWKDVVKPITFNRMIISEAIEEVRDASKLPLEDRLGAYQPRGSASSFIRRGQPDIGRLVDTFREILRCMTIKCVVLLTYNAAQEQGRLELEPWIEESDRSSLESSNRYELAKTFFANLGIDLGDACALECSIPEDEAKIEWIVTWYLNLCGAKNLYAMTDKNVKIVVCHEKDIHACCCDSQFDEQIISISNKYGMTIAPFMIQECS